MKVLGTSCGGFLTVEGVKGNHHWTKKKGRHSNGASVVDRHWGWAPSQGQRNCAKSQRTPQPASTKRFLICGILPTPTAWQAENPHLENVSRTEKISGISQLYSLKLNTQGRVEVWTNETTSPPNPLPRISTKLGRGSWIHSEQLDWQLLATWMQHEKFRRSTAHHSESMGVVPQDSGWARVPTSSGNTRNIPHIIFHNAQATLLHKNPRSPSS